MSCENNTNMNTEATHYQSEVSKMWKQKMTWQWITVIIRIKYMGRAKSPRQFD